MKAHIWTIALVLLSAAGAGCMTETSGPKDFVVPSDAKPTVDQTGPAYRGSNGSTVEDSPAEEAPYSLTIKVTLEKANGPAVPNAAIVIFATKTAIQSEIFHTWVHHEYTPVAAARTDADGQALARLYPNQVLGIAVGDVAGNTTEVRTNVIIGSSGGAGTVTIPLYRTTLPIAATGSFPPNLSGHMLYGGAEPAWYNMPLKFSQDADVHAAYLQRLNTMEYKLRWTNNANQYGDLYAGLAIGTEKPIIVGQDRDQLPTEAAGEESLLVTREQLKPHMERITAAGGPSLAALTDSAALSMGGLSHSYAGTATFAASDFKITG